MRTTARHGRMTNGRRLGAHSPPKPYTPPAMPEGKINLTDLDSRNVKTPRGWVQGYNAQAVSTEDQIVIAAEVHVASAGLRPARADGHRGPRASSRSAGVEQAPEVVLADAGYWHQVQMERFAADGLTVLVPPDANKRGGARPGWDGGLYAFMRRVLATDRGGELYAKRQGDDRAGLRRHQVQPPHRPLLTPRQVRRTVGMAADHRRPQPAQALAAHHGADARLSARGRPRPTRTGRLTPTRILRGNTASPPFTQQPPWSTSTPLGRDLALRKQAKGKRGRAVGGGECRVAWNVMKEGLPAAD